MKKLLLSFLFLSFTLGLYALDVKVLILGPVNSATVQASGPFSLKDLQTNKIYKVEKGGSFNISQNAQTLKVGSVKTNSGVLITAENNGHFTIKNNQYEGKLIIKPAAKGFNIIEQIDLENYLYGVLPYEMSYSWPLEALKAQAVAARTYTLKSLEDKRMKDFDLYSDVRSQMYKGSVKKYDSVKKAVDGTKGQVLKYKDKLFYTYYHANCGGHTDQAAWVNKAEDIKPLQGAKCGYCNKSKNATWKYQAPQADINNFLKKQKVKGSIKKIKVGDKFSSGRAKNLVFTTTQEKKTINCNTFRLAIGSTKLKSCFITKIDGFNFEGRGYGHGRGMCQDGAKGMAQDGKNYKFILSRFYPSSDLTKI
ncbi:MAG: SpoIID/LytB domain-containing protein [Elusimicrobiota bacterium]|jgi:stage II sporulation protein D|nr:SpoIID/LytB domain-containing protein [Elusimicrobiota bacterium]